MLDYRNNRDALHRMLHNHAVEFIIPFIQREMIIGPSRQILEIGCGDGATLSAMLTLGCTCVGVDTHPENISYAGKVLEGYVAANKLHLLKGNWSQLTDQTLMQRQYDLIILNDVLGKHAGDEALLQWINDRMLAGGMVFFTFTPWRMPFGGPQATGKRWLTRNLPWFHLLPKGMYKAMLQWLGEPVNLRIQERQRALSTEQFESMAQTAGLKKVSTKFWVVNPIYGPKYGYRARRQPGWLKSIPVLRDIFTSHAWYLMKKDIELKN